MREILSKEPWWARPPHPGQDESELEWGWLVHYNEGEPRFEFVRERPTDEHELPGVMSDSPLCSLK